MLPFKYVYIYICVCVLKKKNIYVLKPVWRMAGNFDSFFCLWMDAEFGGNRWLSVDE